MDKNITHSSVMTFSGGMLFVLMLVWGVTLSHFWHSYSRINRLYDNPGGAFGYPNIADYVWHIEGTESKRLILDPTNDVVYLKSDYLVGTHKRIIRSAYGDMIASLMGVSLGALIVPYFITLARRRKRKTTSTKQPNNPSHHTAGSCATAQLPAAGER